ncbi:MAG: hypothetical protein HY265_04735 [Deltaproteobacteria bacterium]|nr:hypothetical protein [Deltaproteobacteria bacterium]
MAGKYGEKMARISLIIIIAFAITCPVMYLNGIGSGFCYAEDYHYPGGPYYFKDIKNSAAPYEPVDEINYEEASNLYTYYEAYFNDDGRIVSLKKYQKGKLEWSDKYVYSPAGTLENRELSMSSR